MVAITSGWLQLWGKPTRRGLQSQTESLHSLKQLSNDFNNRFYLFSYIFLDFLFILTRNNQSKSNKLWGWRQLTLLKSSTWTLTFSEVSMVNFSLFSFRFRKAIHHSTKGYSPSCEQKGHYCPGSIRNRKDRHILHRCSPITWSQVTTLSSYHLGTNKRVGPTNQQGHFLFQWILEDQHKMLYRRNWSKRRQKDS